MVAVQRGLACTSRDPSSSPEPAISPLHRLRRRGEEACIEADRPPARRHRAADVVQRAEVGRDARAAPLAQHEPGFLEQFARGGDADGACARRRGPALAACAAFSGPSSRVAGWRWSSASTRPPGNTITSGMKRWRGWRRPISTSGPSGPVRQRIRLAASRGRTRRRTCPSASAPPGLSAEGSSRRGASVKREAPEPQPGRGSRSARAPRAAARHSRTRCSLPGRGRAPPGSAASGAGAARHRRRATGAARCRRRPRDAPRRLAAGAASARCARRPAQRQPGDRIDALRQGEQRPDLLDVAAHVGNRAGAEPCRIGGRDRHAHRQSRVHRGVEESVHVVVGMRAAMQRAGVPGRAACRRRTAAAPARP